MAAAHHVYVGAETGLLKASSLNSELHQIFYTGLNVENSKWENLTSIDKVDRSNEVCVMCWQNQHDEDTILYGTRGGMVKSYSTETHTDTDVLQVTDGDEQILKGLFKLDNKYVTCTNTGTMCIWQEDDEAGDDEETEPTKINCGKDVFFMKLDPHNRTHAAVGGRGQTVKLYNLERPDAGPVFCAKNVPHDWLDLEVPIWDTDVGFFPRQTSSLIVTATGYHQIRIYDPSTSQRRPVVDMLWEEYPITSLCVVPNQERQVIVGNTVGEQALMDLRMKKCVGSKYKGGAGAIRSIQCHPALPVVVSCGLDRYVRIHDMKTRQLTQKFYMKSRLNGLLLRADWETSTGEEDDIKLETADKSDLDNIETTGEDDDIWQELDTVTEDKPKKATKHAIKQEPVAIENEDVVSKPKKKRKRNANA